APSSFLADSFLGLPRSISSGPIYSCRMSSATFQMSSPPCWFCWLVNVVARFLARSLLIGAVNLNLQYALPERWSEMDRDRARLRHGFGTPENWENCPAYCGACFRHSFWGHRSHAVARDWTPLEGLDHKVARTQCETRAGVCRGLAPSFIGPRTVPRLSFFATIAERLFRPRRTGSRLIAYAKRVSVL